MSDFNKLRNIIGVKDFKGVGDSIGMTKFEKLRNIIGGVPKKLILDIGEKTSYYTVEQDVELTEEEGDFRGFAYEISMKPTSAGEGTEIDACLYADDEYIGNVWPAGWSDNPKEVTFYHRINTPDLNDVETQNEPYICDYWYNHFSWEPWIYYTVDATHVSLGAGTHTFKCSIWDWRNVIQYYLKVWLVYGTTKFESKFNGGGKEIDDYYA